VRKRLGEIAQLIRSKNAGPFWLTFDVMFDDAEVYRCVRDQHVLSIEQIAVSYRQDPASVLVFAHDTALAIKVSFPRPVSSGSARDTDVFGGQQYAPLMDLTVELPERSAPS
jgi:hypothetical protein